VGSLILLDKWVGCPHFLMANGPTVKKITTVKSFTEEAQEVNNCMKFDNNWACSIKTFTDVIN
jgi:hypothetical protein